MISLRPMIWLSIMTVSSAFLLALVEVDDDFFPEDRNPLTSKFQKRTKSSFESGLLRCIAVGVFVRENYGKETRVSSPSRITKRFRMDRIVGRGFGLGKRGLAVAPLPTRGLQLTKRGMDRIVGRGFGLSKRAVTTAPLLQRGQQFKKRGMDRISGRGFGLGKRATPFGIGAKRAIDRITGRGFGLAKRAIAGRISKEAALLFEKSRQWPTGKAHVIDLRDLL